MSKSNFIKACRKHLEIQYPTLNAADIAALSALVEVDGEALITLNLERLLPQSRELQVRADSRWWGHNGIALPVKTRDGKHLNPNPSDSPEGRNGLETAIFVCRVALFDGLRPELSLSRDEILDLPFAVLAGIHLAVRRAVPRDTTAPWAAAAERVRTTALPVRPETTPDLGVLRHILDARPGVGWWEERILRCDNRLMTVDEVRAVAATGPVVLDLPDACWSPETLEVTETLGIALVQLELDVRWRDGVVATTGTRPQLPEGLSHFPPLFFVPYEDDDESFVAEGCPYNARHAFCRWIIDNAPAMQAAAPRRFDRLRELLGYGFFPSRLGEHAHRRFLDDGTNPLPEFMEIAKRDVIHIRWLDDVEYEGAFRVLLEEAVTGLCRAAPSIGTPPGRGQPSQVRRRFDGSR